MAVKKMTHLKIITPHGLFFEGDVSLLTVQTLDGYIGIMYKTSPMIAALRICTLFINPKNSPDAREAAISGGLMYSDQESVTVITDAIEYKDEINILRAKKAKETAEEQLKNIKDKREAMLYESALKRAINRINTYEGK